MRIPYKNQIWRVFLSALLVVGSGVLSSWFFYHSTVFGGGWWGGKDQYLPLAVGMMPGVVYAGTTVAIFLLFKKYTSFIHLLFYVLLMSASFVLLFLLSFITLWFVILTGILFCGLGAWLHLYYNDRFIVSIPNRMSDAILAGGAGFLLNDIIMPMPWKTSFLHFWGMEDDLNGSFTLVIFFWQVIVGFRLIWLISRPALKSNAEPS